MLVYDVTNRESYFAIEEWMGEVEKNASTDVVKILIGNKSDLNSERRVSREEGEALASKYGIGFLETSAKHANYVEEAFKLIVKEIQKKTGAKGKTTTSTTAAGRTFQQKKGTTLAQREETSGRATYCCSLL